MHPPGYPADNGDDEQNLFHFFLLAYGRSRAPQQRDLRLESMMQSIREACIAITAADSIE
jgi:hypothetical protein